MSVHPELEKLARSTLEDDMRKTRFTEAQIIGVLKQAEGGTKVADLAREHGVSAATIYSWRAKYTPNNVTDDHYESR